LYCCLERNLVFDVHQLFLDFCHNFFVYDHNLIDGKIMTVLKEQGVGVVLL
jgi:hypothetical protein